MATKLIPAPIDNKNLLEDPFEDDVFGNFYAARDHRDGSRSRHLIGNLKINADDLYIDAIIDVSWKYGGNNIYIKMLACPPTEDFDEMLKDVRKYYERIFKEWENPDNEGLKIIFHRLNVGFDVTFYFEVDE